MRFPFYCGIAFMMLLSSCALLSLRPPVLPGEVPMNHDAGRGGDIFVTVQLEDGKELPFMMDSGCPVTCFDKSLEPMLGKSNGIVQFGTLDGPKMNATIYKAPKLYLQDVRLMTGDSVYAVDLKPYSSEAGRPILGVIGMDILENYCLQLDFTANKIRFLDGWNSDKSNWGRPFPLKIRDDAAYIEANLVGTLAPYSIIDTGCFVDGWLQPESYRRWADDSKPPKKRHAQYPNAILGGEIYTNVVFMENSMNLPLIRIPFVPFGLVMKYNGIGLHFLARNLVTLDFPESTLYLNRTTVGPLEDEESKAVANAEGKLACEFLRNLKEKGKLPGWSKDDIGPIHDLTFKYDFPETFTMDGMQKAGDATFYHYVVFRSSKGDPWELVKAWQTDPKGKVIKLYQLKQPIK